MCDRTREFQALVSALPPPAPVTQKKPALPQVSTLQDFHRASAAIARDIHTTSQKLSQLTKLVQRRGLFNDPAEEINSLVHSVKGDIQGLNASLDQAHTYVLNKKKELGDRNQSASHSVNVVGQLKTELMETTKTFKDVLQQRSSNLKAQNDRKDMFFNKQSQVALGKPQVYRSAGLSPLKPPGAEAPMSNGHGKGHTQGQGQGSVLPRPGQVTSLPEAEQEADPSALTPLIAPQQMQQQLIPEQSYLASRSEAMQDVESHILELGTIFNRLAGMLQDQREMVESIHVNVEDAHENVNRGQLALLSTLRSLTSGRMLAVKVTAILLVFIIFFIMFLA